MITIAEYKDYEIDAHLKSRIVTWTEYQEKIERLSALIDMTYDYVLGIFQGGYMVAMSLTDYLYKSKVGGVISSTKEYEKMVVLTDERNMDLADMQGKKILLVDEVVESGYSIKKCRDILSFFDVKKISTACIYCNIHSNEKIDYYVESFARGVNYIFPWRFNRDCVSLLTDIMKHDLEYDEYRLAELIKATFGINISEAVISDTLNSKEKIFLKKGDRWQIKYEK